MESTSPKERRGYVYRTLQAMSILPVLVLGLVIVISASNTFTKSMYREVETGLKNVSALLSALYDVKYPGDYRYLEPGSDSILKGNVLLSEDYSLIDSLSQEAGMDITLFYQDIRVLTTILDGDGQRFVGTPMDERVVHDVLRAGNSHFYTDISINETRYFCYYSPLYNSDGSIAGVLSVAKPYTQVREAITSSLLPLTAITLLSALIMSWISSSYTEKLVTALQQIKAFLSMVSTGNLSASMAPGLLDRHDELSEMANSAVYMQRSLRRLVEEDTLTGLYSRRFGDCRLKEAQEKASLKGTPFIIALADIDYFKHVNDSYGHGCGDIVLQQVAGVLKEHMETRGIAARWGGEEFLIIMNNMEFPEAENLLLAILEDIRNLKIVYQEHIVQITITLGTAVGKPQGDTDRLLMEADNNLYRGKDNGRNRIESTKEFTA